ncbi:hypothetical protein BU16DRAFT_127886 [Lophium mytilinum]|uniref:Uncharacterized protein n=1 Tax=Lophium mytilinum TaxID=390894 RepID=A0A6A6QIF6_9PEZI|nr:hypothetical protein BU16DRAFT_127886 [Lophium mytilinum]
MSHTIPRREAVQRFNFKGAYFTWLVIVLSMKSSLGNRTGEVYLIHHAVGTRAIRDAKLLPHWALGAQCKSYPGGHSLNF